MLALQVLDGWWWLQYVHPGRLTPAGAHNPHGGSYWFWSGIGSGSPVFVLAVSFVVHLVLSARHRNCHVKGCWRPGHADPAHGFPVCSTHSRHSASLGVPHEKLAPLPPE